MEKKPEDFYHLLVIAEMLNNTDGERMKRYFKNMNTDVKPYLSFLHDRYHRDINKWIEKSALLIPMSLDAD